MACDNPLWLKVKGVDTPLPCGKCPPCKKRRISEWVFRIAWEEEHLATSSHFLTLTYDTAHVPITPHGFLTLRKKDFQDYMKRLRKLCPDSNIRYFACGEYGTKTARPHYHAIVFNVPDPEMFAAAWTLHSSQLGGIQVGSVTGDSIAYTLKYIDKVSFAKKTFRHFRDDREPEFQLQSKGLGAGYLDNKSVCHWHTSDLSRNYVVTRSGYRVSMPRYYRTRLLTQDQMEEQRAIINVAMATKQEKDQFFFLPSKEFPDLSAKLDMQRQARKEKLDRSIKRRKLL